MRRVPVTYSSFSLVNCEEARNTEESSMMNDARQWINAGRTFFLFLGGGGRDVLNLSSKIGFISLK
jgi:hypothetical protein